MNPEEARHALKRSMPKTVLGFEHVVAGRLLPTRELLLEELPKNAVCAEIGVAFGDFTQEILARTSPKRLHLIDAWDSERYQEGFRMIQERLAAQLASGIVEINRGLSVDVLKTFPDAYFDWVYIDTDHTYATTAQELTLCGQKVKPGGRICGHDFTSGNVVKPVPYGVIEACNEFCVRENWGYEFLTLESDGHFSFCLRGF